MKNYLIIAAVFILSSCDKIESPYSVNTASNNVDSTCNETSGIDTTNTDSIWNNTQLIRKVLLEDHTGHRCQGCPAAHDQAQALENVFGDSLVVIAVHAGFWTSLANPFTYDFTTITGNDILTTILPGQAFWPIGTVNRKLNGTTRAVFYPDWSNKIDVALDVPPQAYIHVEPHWNETLRSISAVVKTKFLQNISATCRLSLYYTEDSIINWQAFPSPTGNVSNYVHRHVLRGSLNGTWGNELSVNPVANEVYNTVFCGGSIAADIVPEHVHVVAILTDDATKEIIQVEEVKLLP